MTFRQLLLMWEGAVVERWSHTAQICCLIANANRDPKKRRPFEPDDFHPYSQRRSRRAANPNAIEVNKENIGIMRNAFLGAFKT